MQESEPNSPQARDVASLEPLAQCSDALGGESAFQKSIEHILSTERVIVQTAAIGSPDIQGVIRRSYTLPFFGMCMGSWELLT